MLFNENMRCRELHLMLTETNTVYLDTVDTS